MIYPDLLAFFAAMKRPPRALVWPDAIVGLHVVYGWMPVIPDLKRVIDLSSADRAAVVAALNEASSAISLSPLDAATILQDVKKFANGSLVGSSKLLHFLNPEVFPIWDSRVAKRFLRTLGRPTQDRMRDHRVWTQYYTEVHLWAKHSDAQKQLKVLQGLSSYLAGVSPIRLVELVLFHPAPPRRAKDR